VLLCQIDGGILSLMELRKEPAMTSQLIGGGGGGGG
jgi:hypothetical protein